MRVAIGRKEENGRDDLGRGRVTKVMLGCIYIYFVQSALT